MSNILLTSLPFDLNYITYGLYGLLGVILLFSVIKGLIQGSRKSFFNIIMLILFWVGYFLIISYIPTKDIILSGTLYTSLESILPAVTVPAEKSCGTIVDWLVYFLAPIASGAGLDILADGIYASAYDLVFAVCDIAVKTVFLILFAIVHKIIKAILFNIFVKRFCETNQRKRDRLDRKAQDYYERHHKENRALERQIDRIDKNIAAKPRVKAVGILTGAVRGGLSCIIILAFINALVFTLPSFTTVTQSADAGDKTASECISVSSVISAVPGVIYADEDAADTTDAAEETEKKSSKEDQGKAIYDWIAANIDDSEVILEVLEYVGSYQSSPIAQVTQVEVAGTTFDKWFVDTIFNGASSDEDKEVGLSLRSDLEQVIASVADTAKVLVDNDIKITGDEDITDQLIALINEGKVMEAYKIIDGLFSTSIMQNYLPVVIDYVKTNVLQDYVKFLNPAVQSTADWQAELKTLFEIVDKMVDDGGELDLDNLDIGALIGALDADTLEESKLISYGVISIIIEATNPEGLLGDSLKDYLVVPDNLAAADSDSDGKFDAAWYKSTTSDGELNILIDTLVDLVKEIDFDNVEGSLPKLIGKLADTSYADSVILRASLTKILSENESIKDMIVIPESAYAADKIKVNGVDTKIIDKSELTTVVDGLTKIIDTEATSLSDAINLDAITLGDISEVISDLLDSEILHATVSKYIKDLATGSDAMLSIPEASFDANNMISKTEIETIFEGITNLFGEDATIGALTENLDIDSLIENISEIKPSASSAVLRATITKSLNDMAGETIVIPDDACDTMTDINGAEIKVVKEDELENIIDALDALGEGLNEGKAEGEKISGMDLIDFDNYTLGVLTDDDVLDKMLESKILKATISSFIVDNLGDTLVMDDSLYDGTYIDGTELKAMFKGIAALLGEDTSIAGLNLDVDAIMDNVDGINTALESKIIAATVSKFVTENASSLTIPSTAYAADKITVNGTEKQVISTAELKKLMTAMDALKEEMNKGKTGDEKVSGMDVIDVSNIKISMLGEDELVDAMLDSQIIHATISKKITEISVIQIGIDSQYTSISDGESKLYDGTYIVKTELKAFFKSAALVCGDAGIDSISFEADALLGNSMDLDTLFASEIIVNTVSKKIYEVCGSNENLSFLSAVKDSTNGFMETTMTEKEEKAMVNAVKALGISDFNSVNITFNTLTGLDDNAIETLCKSNIISYNAYLKIQAQNTGSMGGLLEDLDAAIPSGDWYFKTTKDADTLYKLIKSLKTIYGDATLKAAFEGTINADALPSFTSESFINAMTDSNVLCDSIPNILAKFDDTVDSVVKASYKTGVTELYKPDKSDETKFADDAAWTAYWKTGAGNAYTDGQLYKLFAGISAANELFAANTATVATWDDETKEAFKANYNKAKASEILTETIDFTAMDGIVALLG